MRYLLLMAALFLAGCETVPERQPIEVVTAKTAVKVPCIDKDKVPVRPVLRTGSGEYPGGVLAANDITHDLEAFEQYGTEWEAAAAGCIK